MRWITSRLTYDKTYHFEGTEEQLVTKLTLFTHDKWKNGYCRFHQPGYYEISSMISVGSTSFGKLVNLHLIHQPTHTYNQQVNIFTKVRPENWIILTVALIIIINAISKENLVEALLTACLSILLFIIFNITLKVQEELLTEKIIKYLRLKEA